MTQPLSMRGLLLAGGLILLSQAAVLQSPIRDAATELPVAGYQIQAPSSHLIFAPFTTLADYLTLLSLHEQIALQLTVLILLFVVFGFRRGLGLSLCWLVFLAWGVMVDRPMSRLVPENSDTLLIDFHSHTQVSHDGRATFTPERNMRWHQRQGFGAGFITDHNRQEASAWAHAQSIQDWKQTGYRSLMGEEISLFRTHLVLLGNPSVVDNQPYDSDPYKIPLFLKDMKAKGYVVIASLPEYWFYHWGPGVHLMVKNGVGGFEIVNSAPKALDFPIRLRRKIVSLCRQNNLPVTGISDNHGYGYATAVWNAMQIPGWQTMDPPQLQAEVLKQLKTKGFNAVQVLERMKFWPAQPWQKAISGLANPIVYLRSLQPLQRVSCVIWLLIGGMLLRRVWKR